eukprot:SAG31_NODE_32548_length_354_cov_1.011765_1_plen_27_part_10
MYSCFISKKKKGEALQLYSDTPEPQRP